MSLLNPILASNNTYLAVTNFAGNTLAPGIQQLPGLPLTTADGTATGQMCVSTKIVAGTVTATISTAGAANLATTHVTSTGTAATLVAARATRRSVLFRNVETAGSGKDVYIGPATVTTANGFLLKAGESCPFTWVGLFQIIDNGSDHAVVHVADEYD